ncbi:MULTISPECIES: VOC family protein [unclassified Streptomyces]|uniref:VOC family protein n=1 Tax=unclassified Streptomyces TaxID=2593676 RepID=UPI0033BDE614
MALRWSHAALNCRNLDVTEEFYRRWFGMTRARAFDVAGARFVFLRLGDAYLELCSLEPEEAATGPAPEPSADGPHTAGAVRHLAFQTEDVDGFLARMGDAARVTLGPLDFDAFIPGWRSVWLADPEGNVVEVSQGYRDLPEGADGANLTVG